MEGDDAGSRLLSPNTLLARKLARPPSQGGQARHTTGAGSLWSVVCGLRSVVFCKRVERPTRNAYRYSDIDSILMSRWEAGEAKLFSEQGDPNHPSQSPTALLNETRIIMGVSSRHGLWATPFAVDVLPSQSACIALYTEALSMSSEWFPSSTIAPPSKTRTRSEASADDSR